ncbi:helix-turn-helix domain-containing protein [Vibrio sp. 10N.261.55.A7]|uniref:GlxA family transcriptional regulator n=1 Tax=Vibrio sp. 10N.261.55.A7 TaxID=1880851 RepID=UPI001F52DE79|nr:helix-turn-helix domain-containing protein [Vibrio sp. 10N.261.55.A7]
MKSRETFKVVMVVANGISAFHLSVPCLVFRDAFQDAFPDRKPLFDLSLCSVSGCEVATGSGFSISVSDDVSVLEEADIIVIPGWDNAIPHAPTFLIDMLTKAHQRGATLVGLCLGAFVVAETRLLDGKTATTHWGYSEAFTQRYPNVVFDSQPLFIDHEQLITSAGTAASLDCCLHIVRKLHGSDVASQLARVMVTAPFRSGGQQQYIPAPISSRVDQPTSFTLVIEQVEKHVNQPVNIDDLAKRCAMSRRTFTRQFKATYGCTFGEWLLTQRLTLSQQLLESSDYAIAQVAELSGFGSESVYRKNFKTAFQISPSQWRLNFSGMREQE